MRHEVIFGVERGRFWPDELKLSVLQQVGIGGATDTDVARRHDVTRQHVYRWRRQLKDKGLRPEPEGVVFAFMERCLNAVAFPGPLPGMAVGARPLRNWPCAGKELTGAGRIGVRRLPGRDESIH